MKSEIETKEKRNDDTRTRKKIRKAKDGRREKGGKERWKKREKGRKV